MPRALAALSCLIAFLAPGLVLAGVSEEDFKVRTTQNIYNLCTAAAKDPLHDNAVHFCQGFLLGAFEYHEAIHNGPEGKPLVCLPEKPPTRDEAIAMFMEWIKAHPHYLNDKPVESEFRFLMEKWPCKR